MLISFIGAPCSGKTTIAAMVFASLKDASQLAEFVPEQARIYIANKKISKCFGRGKEELASDTYGGVPPWNYPIELTDEDQCKIMQAQADADDLMLLSSGPGITVVTDSSPVNSLFYMSDRCREEVAFSETIKKSIRDTSLFFYVKPIPYQTSVDRNRIHSEKFSKDLDDQIIPLLTRLCPEVLSKLIPLIGSTEQRKIQALTVYYNKLFPGPK